MKNQIVFLSLLAFALLSCSPAKEKEPSGISDSTISLRHVPLFINRDNPEVLKVDFTVSPGDKVLKLKTVTFFMKEDSQPGFLRSVEIKQTKTIENDAETISLPCSFQLKKERILCPVSAEFDSGSHTLSFGFDVKEDALLTQSFTIEKVQLQFKDRSVLTLKPERNFAWRPAQVLRAAGQDNCDTYRIPGLITTGNGTLIAVYDNRYNNSKDLQEDIDVGMSRSTDGGQSWEPMRAIMDMGEWGGKYERLNGIGDPCVLYDHTRNTIWVAALWMSGATEKDMLWNASRPGMNPEETGQFMLVKSTDDGLTWSEPVNITEQIKDPLWQLLLQGPGRGITLNDGTLIFPAQFKADIGEKALDGGQFTCHSTIVFSRDGGKTWKIGAGAKPNTTESQVVQLPDGRLMLNMRDDLNRSVKDKTNGRAVATTSDLGETWQTHPSSNHALPEPNCMASLISANVKIEGTNRQALFFSNPNNKNSRTNMTIKASLDGGLTWHEKYWTELNETDGYGYSCMTMTDGKTVGILYEGVKELYFQKVLVKDIFGE